MNRRAARQGADLEPEFPDGVRSLLLADLPNLEWGVYEFFTNGDGWAPAALVGDDLARLIESGKRYPPALALAREEVVQVFGDHPASQAQFSTAYAAAIRNGLVRQPESPFVLAEALADEAGYLCPGVWYWILEVEGTPPLAFWVSDDFQVFKNPVSDFDLTGQQLKQLGYSG